MQPVESRVVLCDAQGNINLDGAPAIPEQFLKDLRGFDRDLFVLWAPLRRRYLIHQCVEHVPNGAPINNGHTQLCRSIYVVICQDVDGDMVPLNDRVMNTLKEMRSNSERFGGETERGLKNYVNWSNNIDAELAEKREEDLQDLKRYNRKYNRVSFNRLKLMLDHLLTAPNK